MYRFNRLSGGFEIKKDRNFFWSFGIDFFWLCEYNARVHFEKILFQKSNSIWNGWKTRANLIRILIF